MGGRIAWPLLAVLALGAVSGRSGLFATPAMSPPPPTSTSLPPADPWAAPRHRMVEEQIRARDVRDEAVLGVLAEVPRHLFVPETERADAYTDHPLAIAAGQTISQPYIVGLMSELLKVDKRSKVLEIGTGSGYQAAVLSRLAGEVYTMEIVPSLGDEAKTILSRLGYGNVHVRIGDGYKGWLEEAPFDAILLTAAPPSVPEPLLAQLKPGGRMVLPVGTIWQELLVLTKKPDGSIETRKVLPVRFVPMTGEAQGHP
jgi:protein-L-isoaspartate(D-aspartate) O-methyltransferase